MKPSLVIAARPAAPRSLLSVRRVPLVEREVRERLSLTGLELLLRSSRLIVEGGLGDGGGGVAAWFGTAMLTIDLGALRASVREPCDGELAGRVATLLGQDPRFLRRLRTLVEEEAAAVAGRPLADLALEPRIRSDGLLLLVDLDLEGKVA